VTKGHLRTQPGRLASDTMGLFSRRRTSPSTGEPTSARAAREATIGHFTDFVATRVGVEAYLEPSNAHEPTSMLLIATDGEWTRRKVPDAPTAYDVARSLGIPCYEVQRVGYPQRYRDFNSRQNILRKRRRPDPVQ
jgi:hypothetical protein